MFTSIYEPPEAEVARLAAAPEGSTSHELSKLPVNIEGWLEGRIIELPHIKPGPDYTIVVIPFDRYDEKPETSMPYRRHRGTWRCMIVASNHPSYSVGGTKLAISEAELVRGTLRTIEVPVLEVTE